MDDVIMFLRLQCTRQKSEKTVQISKIVTLSIDITQLKYSNKKKEYYLATGIMYHLDYRYKN